MCEIQTSDGKIALAQSAAFSFAAHIVSLRFVLVHTDLIHPKNCEYVNECNVSKRPYLKC